MEYLMLKKVSFLFCASIANFSYVSSDETSHMETISEGILENLKINNTIIGLAAMAASSILNDVVGKACPEYSAIELGVSSGTSYFLDSLFDELSSNKNPSTETDEEKNYTFKDFISSYYFKLLISPVLYGSAISGVYKLLSNVFSKEVAYFSSTGISSLALFIRSITQKTDEVNSKIGKV